MFGSRRSHHAINSHGKKKKKDCKHDAKVKENQNILKRLVNVIVFLRKQKCVFREHDESEEYKIKGMYRELLELLPKYDSITNNHLKIAKMCKQTIPATQN